MAKARVKHSKEVWIEKDLANLLFDKHCIYLKLPISCRKPIYTALKFKITLEQLTPRREKRKR